ncbi:hypothetical protein NHQ30_010831 [Ciborinia camelliae]|nr:hypothetical protein NHQ30_010831 [Ciborinia camelliae]
MDSEQATSETPFLFEKELNDSRGAQPVHAAGWFQENKKYIFPNLISHCAPQRLIYTPARNSLEYVSMRMDEAGTHRSEYMTLGDEADEAWTNLTSRSHVRLSDEDLHAINETSAALGSGGYLGMLAVYHELHCVKWIRWALHQDRYFKEFSTQDKLELPHHIEHCIDVVRQSIQCRANTAIVTYRWTEESRVPQTNYHAEAECMNWEKVEAWADRHRVDISVPGELNHPTYGQSYPKGHKMVEAGKVPAILPAVEYRVDQRNVSSAFEPGASRKRDVPWPSTRRRVDGECIIPVRIGQRQHAGYNRLMDISHPASEDYGKHLIKEEVRSIFAPAEETVGIVKSWLLDSDPIHPNEIIRYENIGWLGVKIPAKHAETLLETLFYEFESPDGYIRIGHDAYYHPAHASGHVDYVKPGI